MSVPVEVTADRDTAPAPSGAPVWRIVRDQSAVDSDVHGRDGEGSVRWLRRVLDLVKPVVEVVAG
jgi:hypothetical protein